MTLPNTVHLHLGSTASLPVAQMREAVRQAAAGPLRSQEGFILSVSSSGDAMTETFALQMAACDLAAPVRQAAKLYTTARLAAPPAP